MQWVTVAVAVGHKFALVATSARYLRVYSHTGAQRALLSPDDDEACGVELEARSSRSPRAAYG